MNKPKSVWQKVWKYRALYLMTLPAVITVFMFHYVPIYGIQIAFKDYRSSLGIWGSEWVGFKHFIYFFKHPMFWQLMRNTLSITITSMLFFPCSLIFALMLHEIKHVKFKKTCQMLTYAPHFISVVVVCSLTTLLLDKDSGAINVIIQALGGKQHNFISDPDAFVWIYNLSGVWQSLGWGTIIYLANLSGVSSDHVEAAKIDGANRFDVIRHVYIPHITPTIVILLVLKMGSVITVGFEKVFLLQNPLNRETANVISTFVYEMGLMNQQMSFSAAVGLFQNVVNILLVLLCNWACKKLVGVGIW